MYIVLYFCCGKSIMPLTSSSLSVIIAVAMFISCTHYLYILGTEIHGGVRATSRLIFYGTSFLFPGVEYVHSVPIWVKPAHILRVARVALDILVSDGYSARCRAGHIAIQHPIVCNELYHESVFRPRHHLATATARDGRFHLLIFTRSWWKYRCTCH